MIKEGKVLMKKWTSNIIWKTYGHFCQSIF